ncbi:Ctr copper transporter family-domain-containing protein [Lipomyces japonicus]|uniref:Ctr copper transporter family-domain-containing protein n=1 Tax=Lipomyces japonicus TaxID=56871 RepID=UPI0034CF8719
MSTFSIFSPTTTWSDLDASKNASTDQSHATACNMNMLFTWDAQDVCIVFQWWRIRNAATLAGTILGIIGLGIGYEFLREMTRRYESAVSNTDRSFELLPLLVYKYIPSRSVRDRLILSFLYAFQVLYSFFLMLIFMSYNGLAMFAVIVGAFIGFFFFGSKTKVRNDDDDDDDDNLLSSNIGTTAVRNGTCH